MGVTARNGRCRRQYDGRILRRTPLSLAFPCAVAAAVSCCAASTVLLATHVLQGAAGMAIALTVVVLAFAGIAVIVQAGMQRPLRRLLDMAAARARIAAELGASQPLGTALTRVCAEVRSGTGCSAVLLLVAASEMADAFAVADGVAPGELEQLLHADGPVGRGYRHRGEHPLVATADPDTGEALLGLRSLCVVPLRSNGHVHGVLVLARATESVTPLDVELAAGAAEHVALALERYAFLAAVQQQASVDDLTRLHNHRFFVDYLAQQVAIAERQGIPLALLMIDIDHFKVLNDTHGHPAGDAALAAFAQTLLGSVRRSDLAARYGGEEFAVVMANTTARDARLVAEKIRAAVAATDVELPDGTTLQLTVSVGGAAFPEDTNSAAALIAVADDALYRAKRAGRNQTCMAGEVTRRAARSDASARTRG